MEILQLVCMECSAGWGLNLTRMCSLVCSFPCSQCGFHFTQPIVKSMALGGSDVLVLLPTYTCVSCRPGFTVDYITINGVIVDYTCVPCDKFNKDWSECQLAFPPKEYRLVPDDLRGNSTTCVSCQLGGVCGPSKPFSTPKMNGKYFRMNDNFCFICKGCVGSCEYIIVKY